MPDGPPLFIDRGPCPLCGGAGFDLVHDFDQIPVRRCLNRACGLLHSARVMTDEGTRKYYAETFGSVFHREGQRINAAVNALALGRLIDPARDGAHRVLDVGTGYGYLLPLLRERGIQGVGVEVSVQESAFGRDTLGVDIRTGLLHEVGLEPASFDAAMCFEVIEHVPRPGPFVAELARHVRPGGLVIVQTDNFAARAVRRMGARFPKWIPHTHVCHFEPASLRACIEAFSGAGLKVERTLSFTPWENAVRGLIGGLRGWADAPARSVWRLEPHLQREMARGYPLAGLRRALAQGWFRVNATADTRGSMMFMVARKG